jgi:alpha-1,3-fucosyltransferase
VNKSDSLLPTTRLTIGKELPSLSYCEPINKSYEQFYAKFNGITYPNKLLLFANKSINFDCLNRNTTIKRILAWNGFFGDYSYVFGLGKITPFKNQNCPVVNCELTADKALINESDYVLVHMKDGMEQAPSYRPSFQRWIFALYESPVHSGDYTAYNGFFNLTSTYRIDSDFPGIYSAFSLIKWPVDSSFNETEDFLAKKVKFAAAVISNCGGSSKRLDYISELQKLISVDVYGRCGKPCPSTFSNSSTPGDCKEILSSEYKFYLAFENSICKDYITEKFFITLRYNVIPVVLGGGAYDYYVFYFI